MSDLAQAIARASLDVPIHGFLDLRPIDPDDFSRGIELTVGEQHLNNVGVMHGGVYPSCLDVAAYFAVLPLLAPGSHATTVSANTSIARGARLGDTIQFVGSVTKIGRTLAFTTAEAVRDGETIATCDLVKAIVPGTPGS